MLAVMAPLVKEPDVAFNPVKISSLGANRILLNANALAYLVKQARRKGNRELLGFGRVSRRGVVHGSMGCTIQTYSMLNQVLTELQVQMDTSKALLIAPFGASTFSSASCMGEPPTREKATHPLWHH